MSIPLAVPTIRGNEWKYVKECLDTNWVSYLGPFVNRFERALSERCSVRNAVVTDSGTAALHLSLLVAGVVPDSEVVMPGLSFVSPANAIRYCGAWPVFVDLSARDWQWDVDKLADFLANGCIRRTDGLYNRSTGRRVSALLPVHLLGDMCDLEVICELARTYSLPIVEDAAECLGATYKGLPIGASLEGFEDVVRLTATSFNGNKIITTGGGGAVFADDDELAAKVRHLSTTAKTDPISFVHDQVGYNYRMTSLAAAVGVAQLEQLDQFVDRKRSIARFYNEAFRLDPTIAPPPRAQHTDPTYWLYTVMLQNAALPVVLELNARGIFARPIWTQLYKLPAFAGNAFVHTSETADRIAAHCVSLPCSTNISDEDIGTVAAALTDILHRS